MSPADAYSILETIAQTTGSEESLVLNEPSAKELKDEEEAEEIRTKRTHVNLPKLDWMMKQGLIKSGDKICVISHPEETATIVDSKHVEYRGERMAAHVFWM